MPEPRSTTRPKKGERRRQLLEQARTLLARSGYSGATAEQIAQTAGSTPAAFARHFADLPAVVAAIAQEMHERLFADPATATDSLGKLHVLVETFHSELKQTASPVRVVFRLLAEAAPEVQPVLQAALEQSAAALAELIRAGQQEGVFRRTLDPQRAAWELLRSLFGQPLFRGIELAAEADNPLAGIDCLLHGLLKTDV